MSSFPLVFRCLLAIALLFGRVKIVPAGVRLHLGTWRGFIDTDRGALDFWRVGDPAFRSIVWSDVVARATGAFQSSGVETSALCAETLASGPVEDLPVRWRPMPRRVPVRARYVFGF